MHKSEDAPKQYMMIGFGALALFSVLRVYRLQKKLEEKKKEEKNKSNSIQETLQTMLMMEMTKRLSHESGLALEKRVRTSSIDSVETHAKDKAHKVQSGQRKFQIIAKFCVDSISKDLINTLTTTMGTKTTRRQSRLSDSKVNITRILLTGGPCAGKTTALAAISQDLTQLGYKVLIVPEAATQIMKGGAMIVSSEFTEQQGLQFQKALMRLQIALEDTFVDIAQMIEDTPVVVLIDRGLLDGSAYVSQNNWQALLDDLGCNTVMLRDNRYDAVLHLVTAADGAEKFYASLNNEARYESVSEAIDKDKRLRDVYLGHRNWYICDNSVPDFNSKINKAKEIVQRVLGHKAGQSFYRKFLLKKSSQRTNMHTMVPVEFAPGQSFEESQVYETFIKFATSEGKVIESSIEKKGQNRAFTYTHKILLERNGQKMVKKRGISASEYIELEQNRIESMRQVFAQRICTIDESLYMIIDYYPEIEGQPLICVIQIDEEEHRKAGEKRVKLPSYLNIDRDITDLLEFQPKSLAKKDFKLPEKDEQEESKKEE